MPPAWIIIGGFVIVWIWFVQANVDTSKDVQSLTCTANVLHQCKCGENGDFQDVYVESCPIYNGNGSFDCLPCPNACLKFWNCTTCSKIQCLSCSLERTGEFCEFSGKNSSSLIFNAEKLKDLSNSEIQFGKTLSANATNTTNSKFPSFETNISTDDNFRTNEKTNIFTDNIDFKKKFQFLPDPFFEAVKFLENSTSLNISIANKKYFDELDEFFEEFSDEEKNNTILKDTKNIQDLPFEPSLYRTFKLTQNYDRSPVESLFLKDVNQNKTLKLEHKIIENKNQKEYSKRSQNKIKSIESSEEGNIEGFSDETHRDILNQTRHYKPNKKNIVPSLSFIIKALPNEFNLPNEYIQTIVPLQTNENKTSMSPSLRNVLIESVFNETMSNISSLKQEPHLNDFSNAFLSKTSHDELSTYNLLTDIPKYKSMLPNSEKKNVQYFNNYDEKSDIDILPNYVNVYTLYCDLFPHDPICLTYTHPEFYNHHYDSFAEDSHYQHYNTDLSKANIPNYINFPNMPPFEISDENHYVLPDQFYPREYPIPNEVLYPHSYYKLYSNDQRNFMNEQEKVSKTNPQSRKENRFPTVNLDFDKTLDEFSLNIGNKHNSSRKHNNLLSNDMNTKIQDFENSLDLKVNESNLKILNLSKIFDSMRKQNVTILPLLIPTKLDSNDKTQNYNGSTENHDLLTKLKIKPNKISEHKKQNSTKYDKAGKNNQEQNILKKLKISITDTENKYTDSKSMKELLKKLSAKSNYSIRRNVIPEKVHLEVSNTLSFQNVQPQKEVKILNINSESPHNGSDESIYKKSNGSKNVSGENNFEINKNNSFIKVFSNDSELIRTRREADDKWCPIIRQSMHGNLNCIMWSYQKLCKLKCHTGYKTNEEIFLCTRQINKWMPPMNPCIGEENNSFKKDSVQFKEEPINSIEQ